MEFIVYLLVSVGSLFVSTDKDAPKLDDVNTEKTEAFYHS